MERVVIVDDDALYRRLLHYFIKNGSSTVSSAAYKLKKKAPDNHISVDLARLSSPVACRDRTGKPGLFGVGVLSVRVPRSLGFTVRHDPNPAEEPDNDAHSLIEGENDMEKCRKLAEKTIICLRPNE